MTACQDLIHQVVNLILTGAHLNLRIQQTCGADDLFYNHAFSFCQFEVGRGCTDVDNLIHLLQKLFEAQRTVVESGRQAETVFHEIALTASVTTIHRTDLRHRYMTLVYEEQIVIGEEVKQAIGAFSCLSAIEIAAIVLDA